MNKQIAFITPTNFFPGFAVALISTLAGSAAAQQATTALSADDLEARRPETAGLKE